MKMLVLIVSLVLSVLLIRKYKWAGVGFSAFCILEFTFRDFGIYRLSFNPLLGKVVFLATTIVLGFTARNLLLTLGDEKE